jgi:hypothetical protein
MSEPRIQPRFEIGATVWCSNPYGAIVAGPVSDVSANDPPVHYIQQAGGGEACAHPAFATQAEAIRYRLNEVEVEVATLKARLRTLEGGAV